MSLYKTTQQLEQFVLPINPSNTATLPTGALWLQDEIVLYEKGTYPTGLSPFTKASYSSAGTVTTNSDNVQIYMSTSGTGDNCGIQINNVSLQAGDKILADYNLTGFQISTKGESDGVTVWGILCYGSNFTKPSYYIQAPQGSVKSIQEVYQRGTNKTAVLEVDHTGVYSIVLQMSNGYVTATAGTFNLYKLYIERG